jgi:hypothetical protein
MEPTLIGWMANKSRRMRAPDVLVLDKTGASPQYQDDKMTGLKLNVNGENMTRSQRKNAGASLVLDGTNLIVKGCRNSRGDHRGLSLNNKVDLKQGHYVWFEIIKNTDIPPGLAVIRDAAPGGDGYAHYTVAPKDDMPLSLFLANLGSLLPAGAKIHKPGVK